MWPQIIFSFAFKELISLSTCQFLVPHDHTINVWTIILKRFFFCFIFSFKSSVELIQLEIALFQFWFVYFLFEVYRYQNDVNFAVNLFVKNMPSNYIFSLTSVGVFNTYISTFSFGVSLLSICYIILWTYTSPEKYLSFCAWNIFSHDLAFIISFMFLATIFIFDLLSCIVDLLITFLLVELKDRF